MSEFGQAAEVLLFRHSCQAILKTENEYDCRGWRGGKRVDVLDLAGNRFLVSLRYEKEKQGWPAVVDLMVVLPALFRLSFSRS